MLDTTSLNNTISAHPVLVTILGVKSENEVKRIAPYLLPVAIIHGGEGGVYANRASAFVYAMPDGELIRLRFKGDNTYDYDKATIFPKNHPALVNAGNDSVDINISEDVPHGEPAREQDVQWLKATIEAQHKRAEKELRAQGLIP